MKRKGDRWLAIAFFHPPTSREGAQLSAAWDWRTISSHYDCLGRLTHATRMNFHRHEIQYGKVGCCAEIHSSIAKEESIWATRCVKAAGCSEARYAPQACVQAEAANTADHYANRGYSRFLASRSADAIPEEACFFPRNRSRCGSAKSHCGRHSMENAASHRGLHALRASARVTRSCQAEAYGFLRQGGLRCWGTSARLDLHSHDAVQRYCCQYAEHAPDRSSRAARSDQSGCFRYLHRSGQTCSSHHDRGCRVCPARSFYPERNCRCC